MFILQLQVYWWNTFQCNYKNPIKKTHKNKDDIFININNKLFKNLKKTEPSAESYA